jgi:hypothetical protein
MRKILNLVLLAATVLAIGCTTTATRTTKPSARTTRTSTQPIDKVMNEPMRGIVGAR